jgi:hypothetical protein
MPQLRAALPDRRGGGAAAGASSAPLNCSSMAATSWKLRMKRRTPSSRSSNGGVWGRKQRHRTMQGRRGQQLHLVQERGQRCALTIASDSGAAGRAIRPA